MMKKRIMAYMCCVLLLFTCNNTISASEMSVQNGEDITEQEEEAETEAIVEENTETATEEATEEATEANNDGEIVSDDSISTESETEAESEKNGIVEAYTDSNYGLTRATASNISVSYAVHLSNGGWTSYASDNAWCGNTGNSNTSQRVEAIKIKLANSTGISGGIKYDVMRTAGVWSGNSFTSYGGADKDGWTDWVTSNVVAGSVGTGQHTEGIRVRLTGKLADYYYASYYVETTTTPSGAGTVSAPKEYQWASLGVNDESFLDKNPNWDPGAYSSSYDFAGTYNYTLPIEAIKVTIKSRKITYTINPNGGTWNKSSDKTTGTMNVNSTKSIAEPTRTGYTFAGWTVTHKASGTEKTNGYQPVTNDIEGKFDSAANEYSSGNMNVTLKAKWTANTYTVSYKGNGNTEGSTTASTHTYDVAKNLTANGFKRTGYSFSGWNTKSDGSGTAYANKASVKNLSSSSGATVKLYAQWSAKSYTLTYNGNGGTTPTAKTALYDSKWGTLSTSTRTGYVFAGWYDAASGGTQITANTVCAGNKTVYAHWTPITYTIAYNGNGNTGGSTIASTHTYDVSSNLTTNGFTKAGYVFAGWNTKADGSGTNYSNNSSVKNLTSAAGTTITLYAKWTADAYILTYDGNGGTSPSVKTGQYNSKWGTLATSTRTGYVFEGWWDAVSGGTQITADTICMGSMTVYAHWTPIKYTIVYDGNGSISGSMTNSVCEYDKSQTLSANGFVRNGYTFVGWNTKSDGTGSSYEDESSVKNLTATAGETIRLYAQWELDEITVSIPRSLILNADGNCTFAIYANNQTGTITVNADKTITLTQEGKNQTLTGTVSFNQDTLTPDRHEIIGTINVDSMTAGSWKTVLNLNITFKL